MPEDDKLQRPAEAAVPERAPQGRQKPHVPESAPEPPADPAAVTIVIDGREVQARKNELLIEAAERAGVYIPRFCYHPRMRSVGMCRMCLVDVKGPRGSTLTPACFTPVSDGQEVVCNSEKVKKAQDGVLEFLLINHPLDCPVCDKGGECPLQDQTLAFGPGETRFVEEKRHWEKPIPLSPLVFLDRERCIQCSRCTRFADEVAGDPLIDFAERGDRTEVATFPDDPFASYFSGNTVQICPVGALTSKPYRFKARPWDLEQVESTCTSCSVGCRVVVQSSADRITRYLGVDSDPVNWSWLCDKGRFDFEAVNNPQRLSAPMVRKGGELVEVSWAEALGVVADKLRPLAGASGNRLAVLGGARLANEDAYAWSKLARTVLGTDNVDAQLGDGLPAELVLGTARATIDQTCAAPLVILLGPDIKEELPVLYLRLRHAALNGPTAVVEIASVRGGFSRYAEDVLQYRPGELPELAEAIVAAEDPGADVAGVSGAQIAALRDRLGAAGEGHSGSGPSVVVVVGRGSLAESADAVARAAAAFGSLPGVAFLSGLRRANVHGALDMGLAPGILPGRVSLESGRAWYQHHWQGALPARRGLGAADMLAAAAEGRIGGMVLLGADPVADFPDRELARRAMERTGFIVAVDCFLTESASAADVVLPVAAYGERRGSTTNLEGRISWLGQKINAPGVAWPDWVVAAEMAQRLGADLGFEQLEDIWDEIGRVSPLHRGLDVAVLTGRLARDGVLVPYDPAALTSRSPAAVDPMTDAGIGSAEIHALIPTSLAAQGAALIPGPALEVDPGVSALSAADVHPESSRVPVVAGGSGSPGQGGPSGAVSAAGGGDGPTAPLPILFAGSVGSPAAGATGAGGAGTGLRLVARRTLWDNGTLVQHSPSLAGLAPAQQLRAHPADLGRLGIGSGQQARVSSSRGSVILSVLADPSVAPGVVALTYNLAGPGPADLIDVTAPTTEITLESL